MAKNLFEFYKSQGKPLPSVAERAPLAAQYGIAGYAGTAEQNNALLAKLQSGTPAGLPAGALPPQAPTTPAGTEAKNNMGGLGNLRAALREALNEASRKRVENNFKQVAPLAEGVPGTIGSVVSMIRAGIKTPVETTFSDIIKTYEESEVKKENAGKEVELDTFTNSSGNRVAVMYNPATGETRDLVLGKVKSEGGGADNELTPYQQWVISQSMVDDEKKAKDDFYKSLNDAGGRLEGYSLEGFMTREQLIQQLQTRYWQFPADQVASEVYNTYPDIRH